MNRDYPPSDAGGLRGAMVLGTDANVRVLVWAGVRGEDPGPLSISDAKSRRRLLDSAGGDVCPGRAFRPSSLPGCAGAAGLRNLLSQIQDRA